MSLTSPVLASPVDAPSSSDEQQSTSVDPSSEGGPSSTSPSAPVSAPVRAHSSEGVHPASNTQNPAALVNRYKNIRTAYNQDGVQAYNRLSHLLRRVFDGTPEEEAGALVTAASEGDVEKCLKLLQPSNAASDKGSRDLKLVQPVAASAIINAKVDGHTALHLAARNGHSKVIEALLAHGGNPAETDDDGNNALHHAAAGDEPSVLEVIVKGRKESHIASNPGSLPKNINKNKPDQKESKKQTSLSATDHDSCDINARNKQKQTALHLGVQKGFHEVVRTLLILGAHPNLQDAEGSTPLHEAVKHPGHEDITALLLRHKADFTVNNNDGCNPIHLASVLGNSGAVHLLLLRIHPHFSWLAAAQREEDGFTALHMAALKDHPTIVECLLTKGKCDPNIRTSKTLQTALHLAVDQQNFAVARILVLKGKCNVNATDKDGDTPLHEALRHHTLMQLKQLEDVCYKHSKGQNPEEKTTTTTTTTTSMLLPDISPRPGTSQRAHCGLDDTPAPATNRRMPSLLMSRAILSQKSFSSIAILLVENGADIHQKNTKDQSPVDLCPDPHLYKVLYKTYEEVLQGTKSHVDFAFRTDQFEPPHLRQNQWRDRKLRSKSAKRIDGRDVAVAKPRNLGIPKQPEATARNPAEQKQDKPASLDKQMAQKPGGGANEERVPSHDDDELREINKLQQQLFDLKRRMTCPVCLDRLKAMVFLCGHGTCQLCGDELTSCPICRKLVQKKILLYN